VNKEQNREDDDKGSRTAKEPVVGPCGGNRSCRLVVVAKAPQGIEILTRIGAYEQHGDKKRGGQEGERNSQYGDSFALPGGSKVRFAVRWLVEVVNYPRRHPTAWRPRENGFLFFRGEQ